MPPIDKQAHFWVGAAIASTEVAYGIPPVVAVISAALIGALKEMWDAAGHGTPDLKDWFATVLGAMVVSPLILIAGS